MKAPSALSVFYCFPRSGGTLLNQCLLCDARNVVLSEVNPAGSVSPAPQQAHEWFGLLSQDEATQLRRETYLTQIRAIERAAHSAGKSLCIRDWVGLNFLSHISPWHGSPSQVLEQRIYLRAAGYQVREIALVRRSRAVFRSLQENVAELRALDAETFATAYRVFLASIADVRKFTMEEFLVEQESTLAAICQALQLHFAPDFADRFHTITTVTGNTTLPAAPASAGWKKIRADGARRSMDSEEPLFAELDLLAGYPREHAR